MQYAFVLCSQKLQNRSDNLIFFSFAILIKDFGISFIVLEKSLSTTSSNPAEKICSYLAYSGTCERIVPTFEIRYGYLLLTKFKNFPYCLSSQHSITSFMVIPCNCTFKSFTGFPLIPIACFLEKSYFTVFPFSKSKIRYCLSLYTLIFIAYFHLIKLIQKSYQCNPCHKSKIPR